MAAATGRQIRSLRTAEPYSSTWVAFSPHGGTLATGSYSFIPATRRSRGAARLWNVATGQQIGKLNKVNFVDAVAFSPDGKTLATGSLDGTARLWNVATGQPISGRLAADIAKVNGGVASVAFSPDGKTLATGDGDGITRLWNAAAHQPIGSPLNSASNIVNSVAFSPDSKTLATGSTDGTARLWNVGYLTDMLGQLCSQIGGSLTRAEWAKYVPAGPPYQKVCR